MENECRIVAWVGVVVFLIYLTMIVLGLVTSERNHIDRECICLAANYTEVRRIAGEWYCIGVRDGNSVVELVDDVRADLDSLGE